jgi:hypothetical protein
MNHAAIQEREGRFGSGIWQNHVIAGEFHNLFSDRLGRKQPTRRSRPLPLSAPDGSYQCALWRVSDLDVALTAYATSVEATIAPAPIAEVELGDGVRGWSAGWQVRHGRHCDVLLICMTDSEPDQVYLRINDHVIPISVSPEVGPRSASLSGRALDELTTAFCERVLATLLLAVEIVVSAPTILSISTAF